MYEIFSREETFEDETILRFEGAFVAPGTSVQMWPSLFKMFSIDGARVFTVIGGALLTCIGEDANRHQVVLGVYYGRSEDQDNLSRFVDILKRTYAGFENATGLCDLGTAISGALHDAGFTKLCTCVFHVRQNVQASFAGTAAHFLDAIYSLARVSSEVQLREWQQDMISKHPSHVLQIQYVLQRRNEFVSFCLLSEGICRKNILVSMCESYNQAVKEGGRKRGVLTMFEAIVRQNLEW